MVTSSEGIGVESTENFSLATVRDLSATGPDILGRFAFIHLLGSQAQQYLPLFTPQICFEKNLFTEQNI